MVSVNSNDDSVYMANMKKLERISYLLAMQHSAYISFVNHFVLILYELI